MSHDVALWLERRDYISPPRAEEKAVAAPPTTGGKGVRVGVRASPGPEPLTRRVAARQMSPWSRMPVRRVGRGSQRSMARRITRA
eukprot:7958391-Alexandrium_andersonii.AAC.1